MSFVLVVHQLGIEYDKANDQIMATFQEEWNKFGNQ